MMMIGSFKILALGILLSLVSCRSQEKESSDTSKTSSAQKPLLFQEIDIEDISLKSLPTGEEKVAVDEGYINLPKAISRTNSRQSTLLVYPAFTLKIFSSKAGQEFTALPHEWGKDDLDKMRFICEVSQSTLSEATTLEEKSDAEARVQARSTLVSSASFDRLVWIEHERFQALLSGDFDKEPVMNFLFRPRSSEHLNFLLQFENNDRPSLATHADVLEFLEALSFDHNNR